MVYQGANRFIYNWMIVDKGGQYWGTDSLWHSSMQKGAVSRCTEKNIRKKVDKVPGAVKGIKVRKDKKTQMWQRE